MPKPKTLAQAIYDSARHAVESEKGRAELQGISSAQVLEVAQALADAMDKVSHVTLHASLFGLTYFRNAVLHAMQENEQFLKNHTEGIG